MRVLGAAEIRALAPMPQLIDSLREAFPNPPKSPGAR